MIVALGLALAAFAAPPAGASDTPLTFFNGRWSGSGTDRAKVSHPFQRTQCTSEATASPTTLRTRTICRGDKGLNKETEISIVLSQRAISGELHLESNAFPYSFTGSVTGSRTATTAVFKVHTFLLGTVATVSLQVIDRDTYQLSVTDDGKLLTSTRFRRK